MPDRTPRLRLPICTALGLLLASCSGRSNVPRPPDEAPPSVIAGLQEETLRQARAELERGKSLAREGQWSAARLAFDRAVDLLLGMPGGVGADVQAKRLYDEVLATIHEVEYAHLTEIAAPAEELEQSETAAVDELTEAALDELAEEPGSAPAETEPPAATYDLPIELNARVASIVEMFQGRKRDWFQEALDRSGHYLPMFRQVFREEGLPEDLVYLAMVESAFKERAVSRAGARGIWQFISGTGRLYGLRQDFWVDDRFDPEKATRAAARHLKDLYEEFDDWYLAMAAYNSGARRVERAIRRGNSRDFWHLAAKRLLPRETRSYVPLILAATVIAKSPEAYGFTPSVERPREYDVVNLDHPIDLTTAARSSGTSVEEMKRLNPELRRWVTPLDRDNYALRIPKGTLEAFTEALQAIPEDERVRFGTHLVRRGDTLSHIAHRYGTTVEALVAANRVSRRSVIHPGQVLTVPVPPGSLSRDRFAFFDRERFLENGREVYVVRRGDTLGAIARSFGISLSQLRRLNGLSARASRIYPGQRLAVGEGVETAPRSRAAAGPGEVYVVRWGDTLGRIARAHGLSLATLRRLNGLSRGHSRIYPGQKLVVGEGTTVADAETSAASRVVSYRIRRGDTLSRIAQRFGVSVAEIRRWNRIPSDRIVAGESLTIHVTTMN